MNEHIQFTKSVTTAIKPGRPEPVYLEIEGGMDTRETMERIAWFLGTHWDNSARLRISILPPRLEPSGNAFVTLSAGDSPDRAG